MGSSSSIILAWFGLLELHARLYVGEVACTYTCMSLSPESGSLNVSALSVGSSDGCPDFAVKNAFTRITVLHTRKGGRLPVREIDFV